VKKDKIVEWICPNHECGKIFSAKSIAFFMPGDNHPRCDECNRRLIHKVTKVTKKVVK